MRNTFLSCLITKYTLPVVLLGAFLMPFADTATSTQTNPNEFTRIIARDGPAKISNDHPVKISSKTLLPAFKQLQVTPLSKRSRSNKPAVALFSPEVAAQLSRELADTLRRAKPNEDILFQVVDTVPFIGKLANRDVIINGRVFWRRNHLNIIFGAVHHRAKKRWVLGRVVDVVNPPELPARSKIVPLEYQIVPNHGIAFIKTSSGRTRTDWIKINLTQVAKNRQTVTARTPQQLLPVSIEARLEKLQALHAKGLISEQQYRIKAQQILDEL